MDLVAFSLASPCKIDRRGQSLRRNTTARRRNDVSERCGQMHVRSR
jgi:hypothetical protein